MQFVQLRHQPEKTHTYLGSPSLVRGPDGALLATHDYFGRGCPKNHEGEESLTSVYRSENNGQTWANITHIENAYWSTLFRHLNSVYLLGVNQQYGSIVIRRSDDGGHTWTHPSDGHSGLLFPGGPFREPPNYHCAPVPVVEHEGRIYRAFEDCTPNIWGAGFQALVISASAGTDLLSAESWTTSNPLPFLPEWIPSSWGHVDRPGWLEGNVVITPSGDLWNILRFNSKPAVDKAAIVRVHDEGRHVTFDPVDDFMVFPGGMTKFTIRRDERSGVYLTLANDNTDANSPSQRNILSLCTSDDLRHWQVVARLLEDDTGLPWDDSLRLTGFQYVDWQFDDEDIIFLTRSSYLGAHNFHDSNRITFHRLRNFRTWLEL